MQTLFWLSAPKQLKTGMYIFLGWVVLPYAGEMKVALGATVSVPVTLRWVPRPSPPPSTPSQVAAGLNLCCASAGAAPSVLQTPYCAGLLAKRVQHTFAGIAGSASRVMRAAAAHRQGRSCTVTRDAIGDRPQPLKMWCCGGMAAQGAWLIAAGGVTYTLGATVYALRWPNPWPKSFGYHELFHCATILASVFHFTAVGVPPPPPHVHHFPQPPALHRPVALRTAARASSPCSTSHSRPRFIAL